MLAFVSVIAWPVRVICIRIASEACGSVCGLMRRDNRVCVHTCACVCKKAGTHSAVQKAPARKSQVLSF